MKYSQATTLVLFYGLNLNVAVNAEPAVPGEFRNGGFEIVATSNAKQPANWSVDGIGPVYMLDKSVHRNGKYALKIGYKDGANKEGYSGTIQRLSAVGFAGKRVALKAYLRRTSEASKVGIWVAVNGENKKRLLYVNSYEQSFVKGENWSLHKLEIDVPVEAISLLVGAAIHESDGEMWVDDVSMRVVQAVSK
jgi:hypothetical protein